MTKLNVVQLLMPSSVEHLDLVQRVAEETARMAGFPEDDRIDIGLAVREGAVNAMKHAHGFDASKPVDVRFTTNCERFEICVSDQGSGFDPAGIPDPTQTENVWKTSGRGLLLIRSLVDSVDFRVDENGVTLVLVKIRPKESGAAVNDPTDGG